eukprot:13456047-Alexandrium_andersonii.AAC.2
MWISCKGVKLISASSHLVPAALAWFLRVCMCVCERVCLLMSSCTYWRVRAVLAVLWSRCGRWVAVFVNLCPGTCGTLLASVIQDGM